MSASVTAGLISGVTELDRITPVLRELHWIASDLKPGFWLTIDATAAYT